MKAAGDADDMIMIFLDYDNCDGVHENGVLTTMIIMG